LHYLRQVALFAISAPEINCNRQPNLSVPRYAARKYSLEEQPMDFPQSVSIFGFLSVSAVAMFSFIAVVVWSQERRREREAYYRSETLKRIAEAGAGGTSAVEFLREEQSIAARRRKEGLK
jgi:hypothetical protein